MLFSIPVKKRKPHIKIIYYIIYKCDFPHYLIFNLQLTVIVIVTIVTDSAYICQLVYPAGINKKICDSLCSIQKITLICAPYKSITEKPEYP